MRRWATHCPANFLHLRLLMEAEFARLDGRTEQALRLYDRAVDAARRNEFRRDEAMANELAARHLLGVSRRKAAEGYLRAARNLYEGWGARRKVAHLQEEFQQILLVPTPTRGSIAVAGAEAQSGLGAPIDLAALDMASVMKASQAISSEIVLEQLWTITMRIMLENAGGQRGCFVVRKEGQLVIEGLSELGCDAKSVEQSIPFAEPEGALAVPISIVYQVLHTNRPVILQDAAQAGDFAKDAYLQARSPRSILCIPLEHHGKFDGAIYMENNLAAGVFTEDRIEVLKLLARQVSISVENAKLYDDQLRLVEAQRRFVPSQFLESLGHHDIARVSLGEHVHKSMSVMFADLRNFTPIAERLDPRNVIELLNRHFQRMERAISSHGGFISMFAGDEIMALFDSSDAALLAGMQMERALDESNERSAGLGQPTLQMGIGINTGSVVLGTVGGPSRVQCSVVGDTVNLASRIEQLTKLYGARLLISEHTSRTMVDPDVYAIRLVDRVAVAGRSAPIDIYEVIDAERPTRRAAKLATRELLQAATENYFDSNFSVALRYFEKVCATDPHDPVPALFVERCSRHLQDLPSHDWQGFEKLVNK
jgi:class 3 adenylate cyclase